MVVMGETGSQGKVITAKGRDDGRGEKTAKAGWPWRMEPQAAAL